MRYLVAICLMFPSLLLAKDVTVDGYTKKDGSYVAPYHRSSPDNTKDNNYSSPGNYNPSTGKVGGTSDSSYVTPRPSNPKQNNNGNGLQWNN